MSNQYDQRQADPTGLLASLKEASGSTPFLGDTAVLDRLVRDLAGRIFDRFEQFGEGKITQDEAVAADQEECHQLARILIGQNKGYSPMPGWTTGGLAAYIRKRMGESVHDEDDVSVVAQAVAVFVHGVYRHIGRITDDNQAEIQADINDDIRSFVWLLIGAESYD